MEKFNAAKREFDLAWKEFFKDKLKPRNNEEEKKQLEEFNYWYNNVRKQSDTGKTPTEMYKKIYGKEPSESRIMNLEYDEEDIQELWDVASEIFDNEIWKNSGKNMKDLSKEEACRVMFVTGFITNYKMFNKQIKDFEEKIKKDPKDFEDAVEEIKKKFKN